MAPPRPAPVAPAVTKVSSRAESFDIFARTVKRGSARPLLATALLACAGCRTIDAGKVRGPDQPAITITYTGVRDASRLYPDYGNIDGSILTEGAVTMGPQAAPYPGPAKPGPAKPARKGRSP